MRFDHSERTATHCGHRLHISAPAHTPSCPHCTVTRGQADLERAQKKLEAEGGADPPVYMRDRAWNVARIQYALTKRRVQRTVRKDWLRQERERIWEAEHQRYLSGELDIPDSVLFAACAVCAMAKKRGQAYAKPVLPLTVAWWERSGALVDDQILVPNTPPRSPKRRKGRPQPTADRPSYLRNFIQSYRNMRAVSEGHRQAWEESGKLDRAVRHKYGLDEDFEIEPELFAQPMPASHARYHHKQGLAGQLASKRRANRLKRRAEDYKPSRSSLALSLLADDMMLNEEDAEKLRVEEEAAELRRLASTVTTEVGYLYFVGDFECSEDWSYDIERGNMSLIYRTAEIDIDMGQLDEGHVEAEEESEEL